MLAVEVQDSLIIVSGGYGTLIPHPSTPTCPESVVRNLGPVSFSPLSSTPYRISFYSCETYKEEIHEIVAIHNTSPSIQKTLQDRKALLHNSYNASAHFGSFDLDSFQLQNNKEKLTAAQQNTLNKLLVSRALIDYAEGHPVFLHIEIRNQQEPREIIGAISQNGLYLFGQGLVTEPSIPQATSLQHKTLLSRPQLLRRGENDELCLRGILIERQPMPEQEALERYPLGEIVAETTPLRILIDANYNQIPVAAPFAHGWSLVPHHVRAGQTQPAP